MFLTPISSCVILIQTIQLLLIKPLFTKFRPVWLLFLLNFYSPVLSEAYSDKINVFKPDICSTFVYYLPFVTYNTQATTSTERQYIEVHAFSCYGVLVRVSYLSR